MRKKLLSVVLALSMALSLCPATSIAGETVKAAEVSVKVAYCLDFENLSDGKISNNGTEQMGEAVLKGTAKIQTDSVAVGTKNYKSEENHVLVLDGGSKGSSFVELPSSLYKGITSKTGFSYSFWIKPDSSVGSYSRVISSVNANSLDEFAFAPYASDKVWNVVFDDTDVVRAPMASEPEKNVWSFVVFTVNNEEVTFYINGEEKGSFSDSINLPKRLDGMEKLVNNALGKTCSKWTDKDAKVNLDDLCLYKSALSQAEVESLAKAQGFEVTGQSSEKGGANELTDGTPVTDTNLKVSHGDITAKIVEDKNTGRYFITASKGEKTLVDASQLGITASADLTKNMSYVEGSEKSVSGLDEYKLTTGAKREVKETYEELSFKLKKNDAENILTVYVRVYKSGVAYRYELSGVTGQKENITGEASEFVLPADSVIWAGYDTAGNYEYEYQKLKMSSVKSASAKYSVPLLANSGSNWMLFTEAAVFSEEDTYCASHLATTAGTRNLKFAFGKGSGNLVSMTYNQAGVIHTPWRVAVMFDNLNDIVNSTMTSSLNPAADESLYKGSDEWIKTGTVAWSWWSEAGDDPIEYDQQKDYIDFAAQNGWEYVCLDFGWCLWKDYKDKVKELVDYGKEKGVGILLWYGVNNDNHAGFKDAEGKAAYPTYSLKTEEQLEEQFAWCEQVGVKGVKVDYYENDDKGTMTQMYECATIAAKHKINVLFHGCSAPRGEIRTFPNVLGYEAVRGSEWYKWNVGPSVSNLLLYVFNRNVVGGMDFTPVGTQIDQLPVTAGFQLAQVIAYQTGLQNIASSVYKLEGYKGLSMINDVPTSWDEAVLVDGEPGKYLTIARRNNQDWYIAAMTAAARDEKITLNFLGDGNYKAYIYKDNEKGNDVEILEKDVTKESVLELPLSENGGAAIKISKEPMKTTTAYDNYTYYEAEDEGNELGGNAVVNKNQFASGMKQVAGLGGNAYNKLTFKNITVPEDGVYEMRLYYACGVDRRVVYSVDDAAEIRSCKLNAGVNTLAMKQFYVRLKKGENSILFGNAKSKAPNIDRIAISKAAVNEQETVTDLTDDGEQSVDGAQYDYKLYSAVSAILVGGAKIEGNAIGWLGSSASCTATFKVTAEKAGTYKLQVNYFAGETRNVYVSVNNGEKQSYPCPSTGSYTIDSADSIYVDVVLKAGENTIVLSNPSAWCPNIASIGITKTAIADAPSQEPQEPQKPQQKPVAVKKIDVKAKGYEITMITLVKGKKIKLLTSVTPKGASKKLNFKTNKKSVAAVDAKGVVSAKKAGKAKITVLSNDKKSKKVINVTVVNKKKANTKLTLKKTKAVLKKKNQTVQISVKKLSKNTTDLIKYKVTSGKQYIKVDAYGKVTVKKFKKKKSAKVTVSCGKVKKVFKIALK